MFLSLPRINSTTYKTYVNVLLWLVYSATIAFVAFHHEFWRDEVRAFSIATYTTSVSDLFRALKIEGHPPLWYLFLRALYGLFHANWVLPLAGGLIASATAWILIRYSPFSYAAKIVYLFSFFSLYEYSVMCRNYGISILLLFVFCVCYPQRRTQPVLLYILLALLAMTNSYATMVAGMFTVLLTSEMLLLRKYRFTFIAILLMSAFFYWLFQISYPDAGSIVGTRVKTRMIDVFLNFQVFIHNPGVLFGQIYTSPIPFITPTLWIYLIAAYLFPNLRLFFIYVALLCAFSLFSYLVYGMNLRHQGIMLGVTIALVWIDCLLPDPFISNFWQNHLIPRMLSAYGYRLYRTHVFPVLLTIMMIPQISQGIHEDLVDYIAPRSFSEVFGTFIKLNPMLKDAIIMSLPEYLMEPVSYYVPNPTYYLSLRRFDRWTRFTSDCPHQTLKEMLDAAENIHTNTHKPVLILFEPGAIKFGTSGSFVHTYCRWFTWSLQDSIRLYTRAQFIVRLDYSLSGENVDVFLLR